MSKKVMIDPGHAPGNINRGPTGYYEYQGMWKLSNYLKEELTKRGVQADLTRTENQDPSLSERGKKSKGYDMFISEHSNAHNGKARGVEVYYSLQRPGDKVHAQTLSKAISTVMNNPDRGAKTREYPNKPGVDYYGVIRAAVSVGCPHIFLVENGFHDNPQDEAWLKQDSNLRKLAQVQADVICNILGAKPQPQPPSDGETLYRVQVGAFKNKEYADNMYNKLKTDGYDTYMVIADGFYKVQTGAFKNRQNADNLANKLKKAGYDVYITTKAGSPASVTKPEPQQGIKVGDKVQVKNGAKTYIGENLASFVYNTVYDVIQVNGDRVVIGLGKTVTAAMHVNDLIKQ
jgi:N-acetylmuramoyl-L-alanine amidase